MHLSQSLPQPIQGLFKAFRDRDEMAMVAFMYGLLLTKANLANSIVKCPTCQNFCFVPLNAVHHMLAYPRGTRKNICGWVDYSEPHHSDLFSLEQALIRGLTEYLIHNFRIPYHVVSKQCTCFLVGNVGQRPEA